MENKQLDKSVKSMKNITDDRIKMHVQGHDTNRTKILKHTRGWP